MLRVGLTGGIGSGKSTVANFFATHDVPIVDTDAIARELVQPDQPAHAEIVRQFGVDVLDAGGALDRNKMRSRVFGDPAQRLQLEAILHPRIRAQAQQRLVTLKAPYAIIAVPLLIETGFDSIVDRVLVVDCDESTQVQRAAARSDMKPEEVRRVMAAQLSRRERLARADDLIENNAGLAHLQEQVTRLHQHYLALAKG